MADEQDAAWSVVERAAREAYGRLLASLAYRFRDISAAEDALADALASALVRWPNSGVPESPEAWLLTVAKNQLRQAARHRAVVDDPRTRAAVAEIVSIPDVESSGDDRLRLLFICAHPAIDPGVRTPLMLQTVLGLDAARIAGAFCVSSTAMGQRLVRAKQKIRDARLPFEAPGGPELADRLGAVLEAIYAAFAAAWDEGFEHTEPPARAPQRGDEPLHAEALFLGRLLVALLPLEPEALALLALMTFSHARRHARFDAHGTFIPLALHDTALWDRDAIVEADALLLRAASMRRPGPFQLEAAIQSAHCQRLFSGRTPWSAISTLYEALNATAPTLGTRVAHIAALAESGVLDGAMKRLNSIAEAEAGSYAPYWVVVAHLARLGGDAATLRNATERAIALTRDPSLRRYLRTTLQTPAVGPE